MHFNGLKISGALEEFFYQFAIFGFELQKIKLIEENKDLSAVFFELKYR